MIPQTLSRRVLVALAGAGAALCLVGFDGCGDRGDPYRPLPPTVATSPSDVVLQLRNVYFRVDTAGVDALLDDDFTFCYTAADADSLGLDSCWDRETEMVFTANMFSGQEGIRADGSRQPPLDLANAFVGQILPFDPAWEAVTSGPYAGTMRRRYYTSWVSQYEEFDTDFVEGLNEFYVRDVPLVGRYGEVYPRYRILHWRDYGVASAQKHQTISWARLKAKFPTPPPVR